MDPPTDTSYGALRSWARQPDGDGRTTAGTLKLPSRNAGSGP